MGAISHAQIVLSWQENLPGEEMPPEWMWPFEDEIKDWFDQVQAARKNGWDPPGRTDGDEERPMAQNELARNLRGR